MDADRERRDYSLEGLCLGCGYALRGLAEARCPECGRAFVPDDPTTMRVPGWRLPPRPREPFWPKSAGGRILGIAALVSELTCVFGWIVGLEPLFTVGTLLWLCMPIVWVIERRTAPRMSRRETLKTVLGLTVCAWLTLLPDWHHCAHADTVFVGSVGISYSAHGGPCRRAPHDGGVHVAGNWYIAFRMWQH